MKKREYMKDSYMNDDLFIAHLEQKAKEGWLLVSMNEFILTYKQTEPQTLKFQIDYNEITDEYNKILNDLGYTLTAFNDQKYIYYNTNLNADDLYNDEKTVLMARLQQFRISKIVQSFFWTFIFLTNFFLQKKDSLYIIYQFSLSQLLTNTTFYFIMTFFLLSGISYLYTAFYQLLMRRYYQKCLDGINPPPLPSWFLKSHTYVQIFDTIFFISFFPFLFTLIGATSAICYLIFIDVIVLFITYYLFSTHKYYHKLLILLYIVLITGNMVLAEYHKDHLPLINKPLYYQEKVDEAYLENSNDLLVNQQFILPFHSTHYERYAVCFNENIAKIIFEQEIKDLEKYSHYKEMKSYYSPLIEQAYYNYYYFVCIKDNQVLSFQINDGTSIDEILKYYFQPQNG